MKKFLDLLKKLVFKPVPEPDTSAKILEIAHSMRTSPGEWTVDARDLAVVRLAPEPVSFLIDGRLVIDGVLTPITSYEHRELIAARQHWNFGRLRGSMQILDRDELHQQAMLSRFTASARGERA